MSQAKDQPDHWREFQFAPMVIPFEGGQQRLHLLKPLQLGITPDRRVSVKDWGIEMDCARLPELPREVARRFLFLLTAAEQEALTVEEQADVVRIADYVDCRQWCVDRSPPRYQEGMLLSNKESCVVEWHDSSRETLDWKTARALDELNAGERFAAHVKLGKNDKTIRIERVSLLGRPDPASADAV